MRDWLRKKDNKFNLINGAIAFTIVFSMSISGVIIDMFEITNTKLILFIKFICPTVTTSLIAFLLYRIQKKAEEKIFSLIPKDIEKNILDKLDDIRDKMFETPIKLIPDKLNDNLQIILRKEAEEICNYISNLDKKDSISIRNDVAFEMTNKLFKYSNKFDNIKVLDQTFEKWRKEFKDKDTIALPVFMNLTVNIYNMIKEQKCKSFKRIFIIDKKNKENYFNTIDIDNKIIYIPKIGNKDLEQYNPEALSKKNTDEEYILARIRHNEKEMKEFDIETKILFMSMDNPYYKDILEAKDFIMFDDSFLIIEDTVYNTDNQASSYIDISKEKTTTNKNLFNNLLNYSYSIEIAND